MCIEPPGKTREATGTKKQKHKVKPEGSIYMSVYWGLKSVGNKKKKKIVRNPDKKP